MDYLVYVEHKAEYLQFFMWYCDYLERWTMLPPQEKALAPKYDPEARRQEQQQQPRRGKSSKRSASVDEKNKLGKILDMMDREGDRKHAKSLSTSTTASASSLPSIAEMAAETEGKWVPCKSDARLLKK